MNRRSAAVKLIAIGFIGIGFYGIINMLLVIMTGGVGVFFAPFLLLWVISTVNNQRKKYAEKYGFCTLTFMALSEIPLFVISSISAVVITSLHTPDGDLLHATETMVVLLPALFCSITALLIILSTVICSIAEHAPKSRKENYGLTEDR